MCGIAGIVLSHGRPDASTMRIMRERLTHRGPDAAGEHVDDHAALGVRRLRVIDLVTGDQPQSNEDGTVWTVFNGEIYNFRELRESLAARGHRFATASSDTEVIVHLYEDHADGFVEHIDGMFALALWDTRRRRLILARDRQGKKPLLYHATGDGIAFASEHAALLAAMAQPVRVSASAVRQYLRLGYVPAPLDAFDGIRKLPPAHVLVWDERGTRIRPYWTPPAAGTLRLDESEAAAELLRLLERAVARRMVADVPVGAFLSGGVDSSGIVALMARGSARVRTFSIGFAEAGFSELAHARRIAETYGTDHHEFVVGPTELDVLPLLVRHYGEPFADSSAVPTYHLARLTRQHVTVALNGDGGDEIFAGYDRYAAARVASYLDAIPRPIRAIGARAVERLAGGDGRGRSRMRRFARALALPPHDRYLSLAGVFDHAQLRDLLDPAFERSTASAHDGEAEHARLFRTMDPVAAASELDRRTYLPDDLLVKADIASMATSLELRSPLLDTAVVEFGIRLPTALKLRGTRGKHILRKALAGVVPEENLRRAKRGFGVPVGAWFRGDLRAYMEDVVLSTAARQRGYFRAGHVERLLREHSTGAVDHTHRIWSLLMLELWHREMVDVPAAATAA